MSGATFEKLVAAGKLPQPVFLGATLHSRRLALASKREKPPRDRSRAAQSSFAASRRITTVEKILLASRNLGKCENSLYLSQFRERYQLVECAP